MYKKNTNMFWSYSIKNLPASQAALNNNNKDQTVLSAANTSAYLWEVHNFYSQSHKMLRITVWA